MGRVDRISRSVAALRGKPCWGVKKGQGSFLTLEFGEPHLLIREPIKAVHTRFAKVRRALARRHVYVAGQWYLWIYACHWKVLADHRVVGDSTAARRMYRAIRFLDGQALTDVVLAPRGARTRFLFDLGGVLETRPYDRRSTQWLLYEPDGHVLALRGDRRYSYCRGEEGTRGCRAA